MYIVITKELKNNIEINAVRIFKKKFIRYWIYIAISKIKKRKIEVIEE